MAAGLGIMDSDFIYIGQREIWGQEIPFGILPQDARRHIYAIGQTGTGKTTLLRNLIIQHIAAGHGLALLDPHGDLAEELLHLIPPWRADHVVYFNPGDIAFPLSINPLANVSPDERHLVASGIVTAFEGIWGQSWGPRLAYILYNALAALLDCQNTSLLGVNRLLIDPQYREWVLRQVRDPFIRSFWAEEYAAYEPRFMREAISSVQNKIGKFVLNPVVRNILGQVRCKINFRFMMDNQRIFIANLSKGRLGDMADLLGSLITTQFELAAMSRVDQPEDQRQDFVLVVDEFQCFGTQSFASMLAQSRKWGLSLVLSHQFIDQLSLPIRQAVFGNVGTLIAFRVGHNDAEILESHFGNGFPASEFVSLNRYEVLVKLLENGAPREPFRATTLSPLEYRPGRPNKLVSLSRQKYAQPRAVVESKINRWAQGN